MTFIDREDKDTDLWMHKIEIKNSVGHTKFEMSYWMSKCRRETVGCMNVARRGQSVLGIEMYRWNLKMTSRWDFLAYSFPLDAVTN